MVHGCVDMQLPCKSKILLADRSQRYSRRSVVYAFRYPSDFRCIQVLNSVFVGCSRCALDFRFPEKYAHQNDPLNQGNLHDLKLRLKVVRYPGIEVGCHHCFTRFWQCNLWSYIYRQCDRRKVSS